MNTNLCKNTKMVFIGGVTVGKTSITLRIVKDIFDDVNNFSTIGAAFMNWRVNDSQISIWDTAGQERFVSMVPMYYREANIIIFVFDCTNLYTIDAFDNYAEDMFNLFNNESKIPELIILGNKTDAVNANELRNILDKVKTKFNAYVEKLPIKDEHIILVSAKTGYNIENLKKIIIGLDEKIRNINNETNKIKKPSVINLESDYVPKYISDCKCYNT